MYALELLVFWSRQTKLYTMETCKRREKKCIFENALWFSIQNSHYIKIGNEGVLRKFWAWALTQFSKNSKQSALFILKWKSKEAWLFWQKIHILIGSIVDWKTKYHQLECKLRRNLRWVHKSCKLKTH